jgi:dynactin 1
MPHLSDVRSAKSPFQLATILGIVKQTATASVAKDLKPGASVWESISQYVSQLMEEGNKLLPLMLENDNVQKSESVVNTHPASYI